MRSIRNRRACMTGHTSMNADDTKGVCMDRSRWRFVISGYPHGTKVFVYVSI